MNEEQIESYINEQSSKKNFVGIINNKILKLVSILEENVESKYLAKLKSVTQRIRYFIVHFPEIAGEKIAGRIVDYSEEILDLTIDDALDKGLKANFDASGYDDELELFIEAISNVYSKMNNEKKKLVLEETQKLAINSILFYN